MAKNEVATIEQTTAVAIPDDFMAQLAADAKDSAALERPSVSNISLKAGIVSYDGEPVKGNKMEVVIVSSSHLNTFYPNAYDPDNVEQPACFAVSTSGKEMAPHPNVVNPVHPTCEGCPKAEWGSAGGKSRGKACKEVRRLVLIPESALESPEDVEKAELAMVKLPVTSVSAWSNLVNTLAATLKLPPYAVVTELTTQPDAKSQFKVLLTPVRKIGDFEVLKAIMAKREAADTIALLPFEAANTTEAEAVAAKF